MMNIFKRDSLRGRLLAGAAAIAVAVPQVAQAQQDDDSGNGEIIVTATKRETTLQETAAAVSVLGGDTIDKRGMVGMDDYLAALPGVSYQDRGAGSNTITIRGIGFGSQLDPNSPVGSYFGEVPVTGLAPEVNGNQAGNADIKLVDIARVEVLRGPQGTLYGSGSMGGTVRVIPNAPNLQKAEGKVSAEYSYTGERGGHNYSVEGVANVPLIEDRLGLRIAAYRFDTEGWIDNVAVSHPTPLVNTAVARGALREDRRHVGGDTYTGFRATALWRPIDDLSVTVSHMYQKIEQDGYREVQRSLPGKYQQSRVKVGEAGGQDEFVNLDLTVSNLTLEYETGWGNFVNSTSLVKSQGESEVELTFFNTPFIGAASHNYNTKKIFVNELRFVSKFDSWFQVIAGVYYEDRSVDMYRVIRWAGPRPIPPGSHFQTNDNRNLQRQIAGFGELALNPFEPLTLTLGARYFKFEQIVEKARATGFISAAEGRRASIEDVNWKVNLSYEFTPELFAYGQWSQGFREPRFQGIVIPEYDANNNGLVEFQDGIERKVTEGLLAPDTVDNYEIGVKFQSKDRRFQGALTGFMIDWIGIPISPSLTLYQGNGTALYFNAGKARAKGLEFEARLEPIDDLLLDVSASWVNAELSESSPGLGVKGAALPGSADYNVHVGAEKRFGIGGHDAFVRGDYTYVSGYYGTLAETGTPAGNYHLFDVSAGITLDRIKLGLFVKNLTNRQDFTWIDNVFPGDRAYRLRPRTMGVNVSANF